MAAIAELAEGHDLLQAELVEGAAEPRIELGDAGKPGGEAALGVA